MSFVRSIGSLISRLLSWYSNKFKNAGGVGKVSWGCSGLFILLFLCSFPMSLFGGSPTSTPSTELADAPIAEIDEVTAVPSATPRATPTKLVERIESSSADGSIALAGAVEAPTTIEPMATAQATSTPQSTSTSVPTSIPPTATSAPPTNTPVTSPTFDAVRECSADKYNCVDFSNQSLAQGMYDACYAAGYDDPHKLDLNNDGVACQVPDEDAEQNYYNPPTATAQPVPPTNTPAPTNAVVTITNVSKSDEWVDIFNSGGVAQDLAGWKLVSERGGETCWLGGSLGAGQSLRLWMLDDDNDKPGFHCGSEARGVFSNSESDPAVLYNAQGVEVSRY